jgi:molybdopterin converting factor small subunit
LLIAESSIQNLVFSGWTLINRRSRFFSGKQLMVVSVEFYGAQRKLTRTHEVKVPLTENGRVREVAKYISHRYPGLTLSEENFLVIVNNKVSGLNHILDCNDKIAFLPHIGGG